VIAADHPDRALGLQDAAAFRHPFAGEGVIGGEAVELVPVVVDRVDLRIVRPQQIAAQLQIIGRIGEDHVDAGVGQGSQHLDAVAPHHDVGLQIRHGYAAPDSLRADW